MNKFAAFYNCSYFEYISDEWIVNKFAAFYIRSYFDDDGWMNSSRNSKRTQKSRLNENR